MTPAELSKLSPFHRSGGLSEFAKLVADTVFEDECDRRFLLMCKELREAGYRELWVGVAPPGKFWPKDWRSTSQLHAEPPTPQIRGWPSVWRIVEKHFGQCCGNSHQSQILFDLPEKFRGKHEL